MGIYVIVCFALIIVAMMQSKDDSGASATITGSSSNFYEKNKGRTKEGKMKRWTIIKKKKSLKLKKQQIKKK